MSKTNKLKEKEFLNKLIEETPSIKTSFSSIKITLCLLISTIMFMIITPSLIWLSSIILIGFLMLFCLTSLYIVYQYYCYIFNPKFNKSKYNISIVNKTYKNKKLKNMIQSLSKEDKKQVVKSFMYSKKILSIILIVFQIIYIVKYVGLN